MKTDRYCLVSSNSASVVNYFLFSHFCNQEILLHLAIEPFQFCHTNKQALTLKSLFKTNIYSCLPFILIHSPNEDAIMHMFVFILLLKIRKNPPSEVGNIRKNYACYLACPNCPKKLFGALLESSQSKLILYLYFHNFHHQGPSLHYVRVF